MENKITAVEWLKMKLDDIQSQNEYANPYNPEPISYKYIMFLIDYALEMEKEQIMKAFSNGQELPISNPLLPHYSSEEYYNEKYSK